MVWAVVAVAAVGTVVQAKSAKDAAKAAERGTDAAINEQARQFNINKDLQQPFISAGTSALTKFRLGLETSPDTPFLQKFRGEAVGAPDLQRFEFDPRQALNNPALQFQQEQGQRQVDRIAGKNRQLGSGQRLIDAQKFGQGLASQSINEEFGRQFQTNQLQNQQAIQQQGLERQFLGDQLNLSNVEQNRLLTQFGLTNDQFNQRLNRLAGLVDIGAKSGGTLGAAAQRSGENVSNLLNQQGQTNAAAALGRGNVISGAITQGVGAAAQGGLFNQQPQQPPPQTTSQQFGTVPGSQQTQLLAQQQAGF